MPCVSPEFVAHEGAQSHVNKTATKSAGQARIEKKLAYQPRMTVHTDKKSLFP
jgi:hypothetical protein